MFTSLWRAVLAAPVLLALAAPARAREGDEHLFTGNPSGAAADRGKPDNYLMKVRRVTA